MWWIKEYVRRNRQGIFLYLAFVMIFALVTFLYQLPLESAGYAGGLCTVLGGVVFVIDGIRYRSIKLAVGSGEKWYRAFAQTGG